MSYFLLVEGRLLLAAKAAASSERPAVQKLDLIASRHTDGDCLGPDGGTLRLVVSTDQEIENLRELHLPWPKRGNQSYLAVLSFHLLQYSR